MSRPRFLRMPKSIQKNSVIKAMLESNNVKLYDSEWVYPNSEDRFWSINYWWWLDKTSQDENANSLSLYEYNKIMSANWIYDYMKTYMNNKFNAKIDSLLMANCKTGGIRIDGFINKDEGKFYFYTVNIMKRKKCETCKENGKTYVMNIYSFPLNVLEIFANHPDMSVKLLQKPSGLKVSSFFTI